MSKGKHRKPRQRNYAATATAVGVVGATAGLMLNANPAQASPVQAGKVSDTTIANAASNAGLPGCRGVGLSTWVAIALAESGGNPNSHNPYGEDSRGLWQINMRAHAGWVGQRNLYDPATNAWAARKVCDMQGVRAWSTYSNGAYRQFLGRGGAAAAAVAGGGGSVAHAQTSAHAQPSLPTPPQPVTRLLVRGTTAAIRAPWPGTNLSMRAGGPPAEVRAVQQRLADLGYPIAVDGEFGPQTNHMVKDYQLKHRLLLDGVVGPQTWRSLFGCA